MKRATPEEILAIREYHQKRPDNHVGLLLTELEVMTSPPPLVPLEDVIPHEWYFMTGNNDQSWRSIKIGHDIWDMWKLNMLTDSHQIRGPIQWPATVTALQPAT